MGTVDYYSLLGVSRNATQEAIKRAFRRKIIEIHPDVHPDQALASEMTREIVEAYKTLINPAKRTLYNASLARIAEEPVIYQEPVNYHLRYIMSRAFVIGLGVIILLSSAFLIWHAMFANSDPVFKPFTTETTFPLVIRHIPVIIEPSILETEEWYHAQEYQLRLANEWAAQRMIETYKTALQKSLNDGDHSRAEFFRQRINEIYDPCAARF